jgi:aryl-alcohol dehydrogenase-like predicted oxidoreductase
MTECMKTFNISSNQMPYSMVNRTIEKDVVPYCIENNIGILAYSPLQRGILTGKFRKGHKFSDGDNRPTTLYYKEPNLSKINQLTDNLLEIANDRKITLSQLVLNWTTQQPGITCVLAGARDSDQVLDNIKATDFQLTEEEIAIINKHISTLNLDLNL